jgi:Domain of unknown function (DUF1707)
MTNGSMRASDNDRESVVSVLRDAYAEGRLTLDEFDERTAAAYAAKTWGELRELTEDLPVQPVLSAPGATSQPDRGAPFPPMSTVSPDLMLSRPRRPRPLGRMLPAVFIWAVIAAAAGSWPVASVLIVVFICLLAGRVAGGGRW